MTPSNLPSTTNDTATNGAAATDALAEHHVIHVTKTLEKALSTFRDQGLPSLKICCFQSSYEGTSYAFEEHDQFQDPGRYVNGHEFHHRYVKKATARQQIDEACAEGFDLYFNCMWGQPWDTVAGYSEVQYLETKNVPFIGWPSHYLVVNKSDLAKAADKHGIRVPRESRTNFPLIIKPASSCSSLNMTAKSVVHDEEELAEQLRLMEQHCGGNDEILVQEFVDGGEYSAIVFERYDDVVALNPLVYDFPKDFPMEERWLHYKNKFDLVNDGTIKERFLEDGPLAERLKEAAVKAFCAIGGQGGGMWGRVDMRTNAADEIFVLEVNQSPAVFYEIGNKLGDDWVVETFFPGGHQSFFETIVKTKLHWMARTDSRKIGLAQHYSWFAETYDAVADANPMHKIVADFIRPYHYSGTILDIGCGTGKFGECVRRQEGAEKVSLTGIDIAPGMCDFLKATGMYEKVEQGPVQDLVQTFADKSFDHVVSSGMLHFLDAFSFATVMQKAFAVARRSVTVSIEDMPETYNEIATKVLGDFMYSHNNAETMETMRLPAGWKVTDRHHANFWNSPSTKQDVWATLWRFER